MNIYVASFRQAPEIAKYIVDVNDNWREWYISEGVTEIKAGDVVKVINTNPNLPYETKKMYPAYIIARMDYTVTDPGEGEADDTLMIPMEFEDETIESANRWVNVIGPNGYPYFSTNVWETCTPNNGYANEVPWSFITEGVITDYISFQWNDKYYEPGSFSLALPANDENMDVFQEGRYILNEESEHVMMIETVQFNSNLKSDGYIMTISGRSIEAILERRIAFPGQGLNTNEYKGEDGMCKAIYDLITNFFIAPENIAAESSDGTKFFYYPERRVPFIELPDGNNGAGTKDSYIKRPFRASVNQTVSKDDLLKVISELCKNSNLGFKILATPRYGDSRCITWKPILYTGEDKSYSRSDKTRPLLLFSPTVGNVEAIATTKDITNYRNAIFCGVEKESDGYINLTTNATEANYFAQKTGVELIDSFNSNATNLITGIKETMVSKLEPSPLCYTGILFLAIAAARADRDYTATVTEIKRINGKQAFIYADVLGEPGDANYIPVTRDVPGYMEAYTSKNASAEYKIYIPIVLDVEEKVLFIAPVDGTARDKIYFYWVPNPPEGSTGPYPAEWVECDVEYTYIKEKAYGKLIPNINESTAYGNISGGMPVYKGQYEESGVLTRIWTRANPSDDTGSELITAYPSDYISKSDADNIKITFRHAYGDSETVGSGSKTESFILSKVNANCSGEGIDFKNSTAYGWLTLPILKQANADLNNMTFTRLSSIKKSAIQLWFKTFDKYTGGQTQMRWLCQDYISDANQVGIDRREVFVEEDNTDSDDWNASKINQWQSSTVTISVDQEEDEESDEVVNERLMASARKRSGDYRKKRDIDASLELENYKYRYDGPNGYDLGDIIQIDDGWGNLDQFIITGYTISVDTTSGPKRIPTFERYEPLPKAYRRLDYLQVANMILPAKFNRRYINANSASNLNLPPRVYWGSKNASEDTDLGSIENIWSEVQFKMTDIEADLQYIQKTKINDEELPELSKDFALISAIGREVREHFETEDAWSYGMNIPFAIVTTEYKSPYYFLSSKSGVGDRRYIYQHMGDWCDLYINPSSESRYMYHPGVGYKNLYINDMDNQSVDEYTLDNIVYRAEDNGQRHRFYINTPIQSFAQASNVSGTSRSIVNIDSTFMYYGRTMLDNDESKMLSKRPLAPNWYGGQKYNNYPIFADQSVVWNSDWSNPENKYFNNGNTLARKLKEDILPTGSDEDVERYYYNISDSYWGQDNYRYPTYYLSNNTKLYEDLDYENNIVVGGIGYYAYSSKKGDYVRLFDNYDSSHDTNDFDEFILEASPRGCDTNHGVRIFEDGIKIYETDSATRYTRFSNEIRKVDQHQTQGVGLDPTLAFYPDLTTRKLVHDYVPVVYLEGGDDILDTEKYGLFDLVDQVFVPINWGDNENATFIEAGGEIARE